LHEWLEMLVLQNPHWNANILLSFAWARAVILALSFIALWIYGIEAYRYAHPHLNFLTTFGRITLPIYAFLILLDVLWAFSHGRISAFETFNGLTRYLLAVPSAAVATIGLRAAALKAQQDARRPLDIYLNWAALGFAAYSLSQIFVPHMHSWLATLVNAAASSTSTGVPIQAVRTVFALVITFNVFRAVNFLEKERQKQLEEAQAARWQALEQQENLRRDLLRYTVRAQESERAHLSRELHDEMAQTLTAFSLDLKTLQNNLPSEHQANLILSRLQDLARQLSQTMYGMVRSLRPAHLDELGLEAALRYMLVQDYRERGLLVEMDVQGTPYRAEELVETVLFRIAQEALTNIQRHAQASHAQLRLRYEVEEINLIIRDEGRGFDPDQGFVPPHGWGLAGMRERAESVGGYFKIESQPGRGTTVIVQVPAHPRTEVSDVPSAINVGG
jgi:signal transduction histidine kinase